jgi:hypothetical protein
MTRLSRLISFLGERGVTSGDLSAVKIFYPGSAATFRFTWPISRLDWQKAPLRKRDECNHDATMVFRTPETLNILQESGIPCPIVKFGPPNAKAANRPISTWRKPEMVASEWSRPS